MGLFLGLYLKFIGFMTIFYQDLINFAIRFRESQLLQSYF